VEDELEWKDEFRKTYEILGVENLDFGLLVYYTVKIHKG
jgi:hypothetical protein